MAIAVFLAAFALHVPFRSHMAYHWDSAQFALAIHEYDMRLSQPQVPGYFLYVVLGRLVNDFVGDPHASLVWISVVFGSALPGVVYLLATAMFGRRAGMIAGLLAVTSPQVWFHSCVALTYVVDSFLICTMALVLWQVKKRNGTWWDAVMVGALLALIGGVREQSVPALVPLVVFAFWRLERACVAKLALTVVVATGLGMLWFVPMVRTSGGLRTYVEIIHRHATSSPSASLFGGGVDALLKNLACMAGYCWNGLALGAVVLVVALLYRAFRMTAEQKRTWDSQHARGLEFLGMWIVPTMILALVTVTNQPGHVMSHLPGWLILLGIVVGSLERKWPRVVTISAICAVNVVAFVAWPPQWDGVFFGVARTAREISEHDAQLSRLVKTIRRTYSPKDVIICHANEYFLYGLRHFQLYLPEYEQYQMIVDGSASRPPPGKPMWLVRDGRLGFAGKLDLDSEKERIVLLVPPGESVDIFAPYFSRTGLESLARRVVN